MTKRWLSTAWAWVTGYQLQRPDALILETTGRCNRRCPICGASEELTDRARGHMTWELFTGLANEATRLGPAAVFLHAGGEPLLHPRIADMVKELGQRGLPTHLCTNGTLLTTEIAGRLARAGLDTLVVSHPAVSRENYGACRGRLPTEGEDARLAEAMATFGQHGGRMILRATVLHRFVPAGSEGMIEFLRRWVAVPGLDGIEFTGYQPWPNHFREDLLKRLHRVARRCDLSLNRVCVLWDGTITPCSYDVNGRLAIGRWPQITLREAYNCAQIRRIRRGNVRGFERAELCRRCLVPRSSSPLLIARVDKWKRTPENRKNMWVRATGRRAWNALRD